MPDLRISGSVPEVEGMLVVKLAAKYHCAVDQFRAMFLSHMLEAHGGNRTHTARALGLQRTYLLRLIRQLGITISAAGRPSRDC